MPLLLDRCKLTEWPYNVCFLVQMSYSRNFCFKNYWPKCCNPIKLQDYLIIDVSGRNALTSLIFCMEQKVTSETFFGWVSSCMPSHIQTCLDVVWVPFGDMPTLKIIQNERWIVSLGNKNVSPKFKSQNFKRKIASKTITVA